MNPFPLGSSVVRFVLDEGEFHMRKILIDSMKKWLKGFGIEIPEGLRTEFFVDSDTVEFVLDVRNEDGTYTDYVCGLNNDRELKITKFGGEG